MYSCTKFSYGYGYGPATATATDGEMTDAEIREAVVDVKAYIKLTGNGVTPFTKGLMTLLDLATRYLEVKDISPRQLHNWYLDIVQKLPSEASNKKAWRSYDGLSDDQKTIDQYISDQCRLVIAKDYVRKDSLPTVEEIVSMMPTEWPKYKCEVIAKAISERIRKEL